jgi:tetratricopeptide (TPR) repeat protein
VAQDGNFVPALSLLAFDYDITPLYNEARRTGRIAEARKVVDEVVPKAEALAKRAIALDASRADAHAALGYAYMVQGKMVLSEAAFKQALARDPDGTDALHGYSQLLGAFGRIADSLAMRKHLQALEPFFINYVADTAEIFWLDGDDDTALAMLDQFRPGRTSELAQVKASLGRYKEAADHLREMKADNYPPGILELAAKTLEGGPAAAKAANLPDFGTLDWIFVYTGAPERAMAYYENNLAAGYFQPISSTWFWHPSYAALRKSARFKAFAKTIGFADVWRTSGIWPQQCHTVGESDFVCN